MVVCRHKSKHLKRKWKIDGGRVLMAITNTLMMVQAGSPTGVCVVRSRRDITDKAEEAIDAKHIGHSPRGHTPGPHLT